MKHTTGGKECVSICDTWQEQLSHRSPKDRKSWANTFPEFEHTPEAPV